jgi:phage tail-like protein
MGPTDPYRSCRFCVVWDGRAVAGFAEASGLDPDAGGADYRSSRGGRRIPGPLKHGAITLGRGLTTDRAFQQWADSVAAGVRTRKDVVLEVRDERGRPAFRYRLLSSWVSEFQTLPDLDANANAVAIESVRIEHEGWERDTEASAPDE